MLSSNASQASSCADEDDVHVSSDELLYSRTYYISLQEEISDCFKYMKTILTDKLFIEHVKPNKPERKRIHQELHRNIHDLKRIDSSIVFAGETSSGKSSIINAILGKKILPTGILPTTARVCRIRYSEELVVSVRDKNDKEDLERIQYSTTEKMAEKLKTLAKTKDLENKYVDIFMQLPFQQGNVAIVDTPGMGDEDQKGVAKIMMDYLPNALIFVFVINVAAAGGLQKDRSIPILEHAHNSLGEMVSFNHEDAIFLLNKWDMLLEDDEKEIYFESAKERIKSIWKEAKDTRILKLSMSKDFKGHEELFNGFRDELEDLIEKNKERRLKVHLRLLKSFLTEWDKIVSPKLETAIQIAETSKRTLEEASLKVIKLDKIWQKESLNIDASVNRFLDEVTNQLHGYIHHPDFKKVILKNVKTSWRLKVGFDVNVQIEEKTKTWEDKHVHQIYQDTFVKNIDKELKSICGSLADNLIRGFKIPFYVDNPILKGILQSAVSIASGVAIRALLFQPKVALGVATTGVVFTGLVTFGYISDFETVCKKAIDTRIKNLSKSKIKKSLKKRYTKAIKSSMEHALKTMRDEIIKFTEESSNKESELLILGALNDMLFECEARIQNIETQMVNPLG